MNLNKFAVKVFTKMVDKEAQIRHFRQELKIQGFEHPHIIKLVDFNENGKQISFDECQDVRYAVLELAPNGNMLDYISYTAIKEPIIRYYFKQLCEAVDYTHRQGICHRDLKLENLLLDENFNLKVSDFGFCTGIKTKNGDSVLTTCKGTPGYMAPEMMNIGGFNYVTNQNSHKLFNSNGYSGVQTDVFALGVILFSLLMGRPPFRIADINDPFYRLIFTQQNDEFWKPWDQFASQNNFTISSEFKDLFISLVSYNPLMRLSINEILNSWWMKNFTEDSQMPQNEEVIDYMSQIKAVVEEHEMQQQIWLQQTIDSKVEESKAPARGDDNLNDSVLSDCSQIKDDDNLIMHDLEEIEKELNENNENFCDEFDIDDEFLEDEDLDEPYESAKDIKPSHTAPLNSESSEAQKAKQGYIEALQEMTEVDTEVWTTVPDKLLSFLAQYGQMNHWKMVQISNYLLLKIPDSSSNIVEYVLKFEQVEDTKYSLKFLKNEMVSNDVFHSVGSHILELISPYC